MPPLPSRRALPRHLHLVVLPALCGLLTAGFCLVAPGPLPAADADSRLASLGETLFFDPNLSKNRTQSCATCHDPAHAFTDPRPNAKDGAVSLGDDGHSFGVRNVPSVTYAAFSPPFGKTAAGDYVGGQFRDGRADTLEAQAGQPILNPAEMGMPDKASVVARLRENTGYEETFRHLFGPDVFKTADTAFAALGRALAAYERSPAVSPFDSKYDRFLNGTYKLTPQEELGRVLFFSNQFTNCRQCHQLEDFDSTTETFSNYRFHNIGVPRNPATGAPGPDHGLRDRKGIKDPRQEGRFRVPSLRNVAVTAPYMHNGVFKDLRTVILFYNKYNSRSEARQINPETGQPWAPPEVPGTLSEKELHASPALDDRRIDALVAFLKTLTDKRYEHLLEP